MEKDHIIISEEYLRSVHLMIKILKDNFDRFSENLRESFIEESNDITKEEFYEQSLQISTFIRNLSYELDARSIKAFNDEFYKK